MTDLRPTPTRGDQLEGGVVLLYAVVDGIEAGDPVEAGDPRSAAPAGV